MPPKIEQNIRALRGLGSFFEVRGTRCAAHSLSLLLGLHAIFFSALWAAKEEGGTPVGLAALLDWLLPLGSTARAVHHSREECCSGGATALNCRRHPSEKKSPPGLQTVQTFH